MNCIFGIIVLMFISTYILLTPRIILKRDIISLKLITLEIVLQNMMCILASAFLNDSVSKLVLIYKEIIIYGTVLLVFFIKYPIKIKKSSLPALFMIFICIPYFFIGEVSVYTKLICFRQIMTPIILIMYGRTFLLDKNELNDYMKFVVKIGVFIVAFGIVEEFIVGDCLWTSLNIEKYMAMKGFSLWVYGNHLPGNFYSADLVSSYGMLRRMVSIMAEPLLTGLYLALCIVVLLYQDIFKNLKCRIACLIVLTAGVILTLSKGAILTIVIAYVCKIWKKNKAVASICMLIGCVAIVYMIENNKLYTLSQHMNGLASSFVSVAGSGLGTAGNYAKLYGKVRSNVGESYLGALLVQTGVVGLVAFLNVFLFYSKKIIYRNKNAIAQSIVAYIIAVVLEALVAESTINYVGSGICFILFGILTTINLNNETDNYFKLHNELLDE